MPEFSDIHAIYTPDRKLTQTEILRALKFAIASEFEAIQLYQQIMEATDNISVKKVLFEITNDEKHHAGGLYKLLEILSPQDAQEYEIGFTETLENIAE